MRILFGDVNQVVKGIRQSVAKRGFFGAKPMKQAAITITASVTTTGAELADALYCEIFGIQSH